MVHRYLTALAFLTRLAPGRHCTAQEMAASLPCFPLVGLTLGLLQVAPLPLGLGRGQPWLQAWLWLALEMLLTRGLHHDGLADVADGWGSLRQGEEFWRIVKDSRIGAFGVAALTLVLAGQGIAVADLAATGRWGALVCLPLLGRLAPVVLAWAGRGLTRQGLGALFAAQAHGRALGLALGLGLIPCLVLVPLPGLLAALLAASLPVGLLLRLGRRQGGINGDFHGACILLSELAVGLALVVTG